jgi:hypothetical protein
MNLDEAQKQKVAAWIAEGLKLSDIQKRLGTEFGAYVTYMEVRLLVDDLRLTPTDVERAKPNELAASTPASPPNPGPAPSPLGASAPPSATPPSAGVTVSVDEISRPGTVASGQVTFTDGNSAEWYLDQTGRLGLMPKQQGYRPPQQDVAAFQQELQNVLSRLGF